MVIINAETLQVLFYNVTFNLMETDGFTVAGYLRTFDLAGQFIGMKMSTMINMILIVFKCGYGTENYPKLSV